MFLTPLTLPKVQPLPKLFWGQNQKWKSWPNSVHREGGRGVILAFSTAKTKGFFLGSPSTLPDRRVQIDGEVFSCHGKGINWGHWWCTRANCKCKNSQVLKRSAWTDKVSSIFLCIVNYSHSEHLNFNLSFLSFKVKFFVFLCIFHRYFCLHSYSTAAECRGCLGVNYSRSVHLSARSFLKTPLRRRHWRKDH